MCLDFLLSLLKNILMPVHVRTTSISTWGVRHRYLAVALAAQSYCHVAYAGPSAIRLRTTPQAIANKNLRRNRLPKSTSWLFPSATPPTYHFYKRPEGKQDLHLEKKRTRRTCTLGTIFFTQVGSPALSARGRRSTAAPSDIMCLYQYLYFSSSHSKLTLVTYCGQVMSLSQAGS